MMQDGWQGKKKKRRKEKVKHTKVKNGSFAPGGGAGSTSKDRQAGDEGGGATK